MSISPRCSRAAAISARTPASVAASPGKGNPPTCSATAAAAAPSRSLTTTRAPAAPSPRASARPIPAPAPVTTTPALSTVSNATSAGYRAARSAFERFLQLASDLVDRGVHPVLGDLGGTGKRLVECLLDNGLAADHEEPCLVSREFLSRLTELLAGKSPAPEPLRDDTDARPVQPLDHMGLAVLLVDHGRVQRADRPVLVQLLDGGQSLLRVRDAAERRGMHNQLVFISHDISLDRINPGWMS